MRGEREAGDVVWDWGLVKPSDCFAQIPKMGSEKLLDPSDGAT
jgi:hypothetical protein